MGERTFEITSWGTKDGYSTAHVNWIESTDTPETDEEAAECARKVPVGFQCKFTIVKKEIVLGTFQLQEVCQSVVRARGNRYLEAVDAQVGPMPSSPGTSSMVVCDLVVSSTITYNFEQDISTSLNLLMSHFKWQGGSNPNF